MLGFLDLFRAVEDVAHIKLLLQVSCLLLSYSRHIYFLKSLKNDITYYYQKLLTSSINQANILVNLWLGLKGDDSKRKSERNLSYYYSFMINYARI
jgi:hypothetical protein